MELNPEDMAVIEQALWEGLNAGIDYQKMMRYREVLSKLQQFPVDRDVRIPDETSQMNRDHGTHQLF